jgi:hypothetical protein
MAYGGIRSRGEVYVDTGVGLIRIRLIVERRDSMIKLFKLK